MTRFLVILFVMIGTAVNAQYNFVYRQYVQNQLGLNPGYTGSREVFSMAYQYRSQWNGLNIDGAPLTNTFALDAPMKGEKVALGFYGINERIGNTNQYNFDVNYAYRIHFGGGKLSMGLKASANMFSIGSSETIISQDRAFFGESQFNFMPNFGAGVYYYGYNRFFFGLSVPSFFSYSGDTINQEFKLSHDIKKYNFLGSMGVLLRFGDFDALKVRLSSLAEYNMVSSYALDVNTMFIIKDLVWVGGSFHSAKITSYMAQVQVNPQLRIGYSYDMGLGNLNFGTGHEIMIRYEFSYQINAESPLF